MCIRDSQRGGQRGGGNQSQRGQEETWEDTEEGRQAGAADSMESDTWVPDSFYKGLPRPWNTVPCREQGSGKKDTQDFFKMKQNTRLPIFSGDIEEYQEWREAFLFLIHVQNIEVAYKCMALKNVLDDSDPEVAAIKHAIRLSPVYYKAAIEARGR